MSIIELNDKYYAAWNEFVLDHAEGTFFHLAEWQKILEQSFGCKTFYFAAEESRKITGILPLALIKRPLFGAALISSPLCVYGGGLGDVKALEEAAAAKAEELGVQYLELRAQYEETHHGWPVSHHFFTFKRMLSDDHEENLKNIPRKQRAEVRKGMKGNLKTVINQDIDLFYKIYSTSVRNLGTPIFSKKYLRDLMDVFGDCCEITTISHGNNPLTSVLSFKYKDQILPYYGGGLPEARNHSAYPYMYWKVMEKAVNEGLRVFDFGRSMKGSGAYAFKKNFGFEPMPLAYRYHLVKAKDLPNMDPDAPLNKMIVKCWQKLPLPIANKVGPFLYPVIM